MEKEEEIVGHLFGEKKFSDIPIHLKLGLILYSIGFLGGILVLFYAVYSWFTRLF